LVGQSNTLVRTIGRWSLTALVINSIIGSGVFGLPSVVSSHLGRMAPIAYFIARAGMAIIAGFLAKSLPNFEKPVALICTPAKPSAVSGVFKSPG
jgi:amino acid transporter